MLNYFYDHDLVTYSDAELTDWRDAVRESCRKLLEKDLITNEYVEEIIQCVEKHGPYIVIIPEVAMPHSSEDSAGVKGTAISFTKMKNKIQFESVDGEEKSATLFFTLAAKNPEEHMKNIQNLSELLMTDGLVDDLVQTKNIDDYKKVMKKYTEKEK